MRCMVNQEMDKCASLRVSYHLAAGRGQLAPFVEQGCLTQSLNMSKHRL